MATPLAATGFAWQSTMSADGGYVTGIMLPGVLMMLGAGLASTSLASPAIAGAEPGDAGLPSGLVDTSRAMARARWASRCCRRSRPPHPSADRPPHVIRLRHPSGVVPLRASRGGR